MPSGWKAKNRGKLTSLLASNRQPVVLEPCLDIFEAHKPDLLDCAHVVPMVVIMSIVVAHNPENQSLLPSNAYYLPTDVENEKGVTSISLVTPLFGGVADGTRTHDDRNHNPGLYQLSYSHHR